MNTNNNPKRLTPQQLAVRKLNELINPSDKVYVMRQFFPDGGTALQVSVRKASAPKATNVTSVIAQAFGVMITPGRGMNCVEYLLIIEMCEQIPTMPFEIDRIEVTKDMRIIDYGRTTSGKIAL